MSETTVQNSPLTITAAIKVTVGEVSKTYATTLPADGTRTTRQIAEEAWVITKKAAEDDATEDEE